MYHIIDNIYQGKIHDAHNLNLIALNNIDIVVRLSEDRNDNIYGDRIQFYNFEIEDNALYKTELINYSKFIRGIIDNNRDRNILIHCNEGQSRSVSVIIFYLMTRHKLSYDESHSFIKSIKLDIRPNYAFERTLRTFE